MLVASLTVLWATKSVFVQEPLIKPTKFTHKYSGVNLIVPDAVFPGVNQARCRFFDNWGKTLFQLPGGICFLVPELGLYYSQVNENGNLALVLFKRKKIVWKKSIDTHHDAVIDPNTKDIIILTRQARKINGQTVFHDGLERYNLEGDLVYSWYSWDYADELSKHLFYHRKNLLETTYVDDRNRNIGIKINSLALIKNHPLKSDNPIFQDGNIALSFNQASSLIIINPTTKKVLWSYRLSDDVFQGAHSIRFRENGNLLFFENRGLIGGHGDKTRSQVVELEPIKKQRVWIYPKSIEQSISCPSGCSAFELENKNILISYQSNRSVIEVSRNGEILWEWFSDDFKSDGSRRGYKNVFRHANSKIQQFLEKSGL